MGQSYTIPCETATGKKNAPYETGRERLFILYNFGYSFAGVCQ
jgi:hypothetical protein